MESKEIDMVSVGDVQLTGTDRVRIFIENPMLNTNQ